MPGGTFATFPSPPRKPEWFTKRVPVSRLIPNLALARRLRTTSPTPLSYSVLPLETLLGPHTTKEAELALLLATTRTSLIGVLLLAGLFRSCSSP